MYIFGHPSHEMKYTIPFRFSVGSFGCTKCTVHLPESSHGAEHHLDLQGFLDTPEAIGVG